MRISLLLLMTVLLNVPNVFADTTWQVAPGRTQIGFNVKHLVFMDVKGKFKDFEGSVISTDDSLKDASMAVRIDARSIYTGIADRDNHLIGEDFFFTEKYPEIVFKSTAVEPIAGDAERYKITGDLTIRGVTRQIVLTAECTAKKSLANGRTRIDLKAVGQVNRFEYGLHWNELVEAGKAIVGEKVDLTLKIALLN
ncbi:MAG: YceI family protein [Candidatus Omnitrophica bacterium]|nr:YceI family protein [Candidatus Omnitrophota bacterium]